MNNRDKEDKKSCNLVIIGVNQEGSKELLAIKDGIRESDISWKELLLDLQNRGLKAPKLAIGDGALGFWSALREVYPDTREQMGVFGVSKKLLGICFSNSMGHT